MFNIAGQNSKPEKFWEKLGTFFQRLPDTTKSQIQAYWEGLNRTKEGLKYSLNRDSGLSSLKKDTGYYEEISETFSIIFEDLDSENRADVEKVFLKPPINLNYTQAGVAGGGSYYYKVSALNSYGESLASKVLKVPEATSPSVNSIILSWDPVDGATSYNIYGRALGGERLLGVTNSSTFSFTDTGSAHQDENKAPAQTPTALNGYSFEIPGDLIYLGIPELRERATGTTLTQGTHYELLRGRELKFSPDVPITLELYTNLKRNFFISDSSICLSPRIQHFYLKIFGVKNVSEFIKSGFYLPALSGYSSLSLKEKALKRGEHFKYWVWAYSTTLRKSPTMDNILKGWALVNGYPFAYESGEVTAKSATTITIEGENTIEYDLLGNTSTLVVGNNVDQFEILIQGAQVKDYITHPNDLISLATSEEEPRLFINLLSTAVNLTSSEEVIQAFKKSAIPAGLTVKE